MTRAARFTSADISRAVRAFEKAGLHVGAVRFTKDGFEIVAGETEKQDTAKWFADSPLYRDVA